MVQRLKYEDQQRLYRYTKVQGLLDGNPPWSSQKLRDLGQGHRANFNLREGEGIVDAAKTPYYDLIFEVPEFANITLEFADADPTLNRQWSNILEEEYYEALCGWTGFDRMVQLHQYQMIVNGVGPVFWPHSIGWHSEALKARKMMVPQEAYASVDDLEFVVILHQYRADELESFISNESAAETAGWNVQIVKQAIIDSAKHEMRSEWGVENFDLYQRAIRSGDLFYGIDRSDRIFVASLFIREFGGKISHYMLTDAYIESEKYRTPEVMPEDQEYGYLFKKKYRFEEFSQVICPFFFDVGPDGTWHTIKGLGPKIYDFCDVSNRTFCQMLDGAVIGSGVTLEAQDANALEETQIVQIGGATVVQPGYKVVQTRIAEALNGAMAMRRELQNTLQQNTGSYRQRVAGEREMQEPTLGQAQLNWQAQGTLTKGAINRYCNQFDRWHQETLRRLMDPRQGPGVPGGKEAQKFQERCLRRGIPEEVFKFEHVFKVSAVRSLGYGSPQIRDMATKELIQLLPFMDEVSRNHALRMRAVALPGIGQANVDSVFPDIQKRGIPNNHNWDAAMENNSLRTLGEKVPIVPGQNHSIHFDTHMQDLMTELQNPNRSPVDKLIHMEQAGVHLQGHLQGLSQDPTRKQEVKQKQQALRQLAKATDQLQQQVQEKAQAAAGQNGQQGQPQQPSPEAQAKLAKVHGDLGLKAQKQKGELALKARKQQVHERLEDLKTAAEIKRNDRRTDSGI